MSKIVIDVEDSFHKAVRIQAIEEGITMKDFIVNAVMEKVGLNKKVTFKKELKSSMKANDSILKELAEK